jgi:YihY family inner membrane protein
MSITERLDRWQRRFPRVGFPIATIYKFGDDNGNYLAALITYYSFISILPMMLLASTILSIVLVGHPDLQKQLLDSALAEFPVIGAQLKFPEALGGGTVGIVVGILGALYGALGAAQALQFAGNTMWHVPRNSRPNPLVARGRSIILISTSGLGLLVSVVASAYFTKLFQNSRADRGATFLIGATTLTLVFLVAFQLAPHKTVPYRDLLPGAVVAAVTFQGLQSFGYVYVGRVVAHATAVNAVFALVLGMLAYLYIAAFIVVMAMEINVVRTERLWPRALLTPFTDNVDLTDADEESYRAQAQAQRTKGFEQIDVHFHEHENDREHAPDEE